MQMNEEIIDGGDKKDKKVLENTVAQNRASRRFRMNGLGMALRTTFMSLSAYRPRLCVLHQINKGPPLPLLIWTISHTSHFLCIFLLLVYTLLCLFYPIVKHRYSQKPQLVT